MMMMSLSKLTRNHEITWKAWPDMDKVLHQRASTRFTIPTEPGDWEGLVCVYQLLDKFTSWTKIFYKWFVLKQYNSFLRSVLYSTKWNPHAVRIISQKRDLESSTLLMQLTTVSLVLKLLQQIEENTTSKANVKSRNALTLPPIG